MKLPNLKNIIRNEVRDSSGSIISREVFDSLGSLIPSYVLFIAKLEDYAFSTKNDI